MRRKEREITNHSDIKKILEKSHVCRLALFDETYPYVVPTNFGYEWQEEQLMLYIHGARQGKKLTLLQKNPHVGFEMDTNHELIIGDMACDYSFAYASIIGQAIAELTNSFELKTHALQKIMEHETGRNDFTFQEKHVQSTAIIILKVQNFTVKAHETRKAE